MGEELELKLQEEFDFMWQNNVAEERGNFIADGDVNVLMDGMALYMIVANRLKNDMCRQVWRWILLEAVFLLDLLQIEELRMQIPRKSAIKKNLEKI